MARIKPAPSASVDWNDDSDDVLMADPHAKCDRWLRHNVDLTFYAGKYLVFQPDRDHPVGAFESKDEVFKLSAPIPYCVHYPDRTSQPLEIKRRKDEKTFATTTTAQSLSIIHLMDRKCRSNNRLFHLINIPDDLRIVLASVERQRPRANRTTWNALRAVFFENPGRSCDICTQQPSYESDEAYAAAVRMLKDKTRYAHMATTDATFRNANKCVFTEIVSYRIRY